MRRRFNSLLAGSRAYLGSLAARLPAPGTVERSGSRSQRRILLFGVAVYIFALLITFPAERAAEWSANMVRDTGVRLAASGITGTLWSGSAAATSVNGIMLGHTEWSLSPWWLPLGRAQIHWRLEPEGGYLDGYTRFSPSAIKLHDLEGTLPAALLVSYARAPSFVSVDGKVSVHVGELVRSKQGIEAAQATLLWSGAALVQPAAARLGDLRVELSPGPRGALSGKLSDGGGPLALSGDLTINPDMSYRLNATLATRKDADAALVNALPLIGRANGNGGYTVTWAGRFSR